MHKKRKIELLINGKHTGPIVRIAPGEVHIRDTEFFDVLYSQSRQADKLDSLRYRFNSPHSVAVTVSSTLHRQRRAAMNPFFSKQRIAKQAVNIQAHMDELCARIAKEYAGKNEVLNLTLAWPCYTCDNILEMCLGHNPNLIDRPDWTSYLTTVMVDLLEGVHMVTQFPAALTVMQALPESVVVKMDPRMSSVFAFNNVSRLHPPYFCFFDISRKHAMYFTFAVNNFSYNRKYMTSLERS